MRVTIVLNGRLESLPPVLSVCHALAETGHHVHLITNFIEPENAGELREKGVKITTFRKHPDIRNTSLPVRACRWISFRWQIWNLLRKEQYDFLWIASAETALLMGKRLLKERYVLQMHELYDTYPVRIRKLKPLAQKACLVFVPELNRGRIFRAWFDLPEFPVILPNKPYRHPRKRNIPLTNEKVKSVIEGLGRDAKIVLYQGGIGKERDLRPVARAVSELGSPWKLVIQGILMGNDEYTKDFLANYEYTLVPPVPAPKHLETAAHAYIGIAAYVHDSLNTEFCAPNKIYEYTGFGLPVIANDVAGLQDTIGRYRAGICINFATADTAEIKHCLEEIDTAYSGYAACAAEFYEACDLKAIIVTAFERLRNRK